MDIEFDYSHDLIYLLDLLPEDISIPPDKYKKVALLNGFGVQIRYPNKILHMTKQELEEAISIA